MLPGVPELARHGLIPQELRAAALHFADPQWMTDAAETPAEALERSLAWRRLVRLLVARFPQDIEVDGEWHDVGQTLEQRVAAIGTPERPGTMDPLDVDVLEDLVLRYSTPEQISRKSRVMRGTGSVDDARYVLPELRRSLAAGRMSGPIREYIEGLVEQLEQQVAAAGLTEATEADGGEMATVADLATFRGDGRSAPNRAARRSRRRSVAGSVGSPDHRRPARVPGR